MTTVNQGMSVEEIKQVVAQRVANAIEAIAIYEKKTNLARKSMSQMTRRKECGNCKNVGHIIQICRTPATAKNQRTRTYYKCGSLGHYKSECPIVKFHKRVDMIHERMRASKPKTMQDAIEIATKLRNKKISTLVECQTANKKRLDNTYKNNQNQQQPNKRKNTGRAYTARHGEKKHYSGSKPLCSKCNYHHDGPCAPKCHQCNRFGHLARDYFPEEVPEDFSSTSTNPKSGISNQLGTWSYTRSTGSLSTGAFQNERLAGTAERAV
nr:hypothetical protein [Tanacetum cinerariifolium]